MNEAVVRQRLAELQRDLDENIRLWPEAGPGPVDRAVRMIVRMRLLAGPGASLPTRPATVHRTEGDT